MTPDWTNTLLDEGRRADIAQRHLVSALRNLANLPGNAAVRPSVVLRNLFEEVGWQRDLAADPELFRADLAELGRLIATWQLLDPVLAAAQPPRGRLRRGLDWLLGRIATPVPPEAEPTPAGLADTT